MTADYWAVAREVCTEKQLRVLELRERRGMSLYAIGHALDLSPSTVRGHLRDATRKVRRALEAS